MSLKTSQRLAELSSKLKDQRNTSTVDAYASDTPFPLVYLLTMYTTHRKLLYVNYYRRMKLLIDWLEPIEIPEFPELANKKLHTIYYNYDLQELSRHLNTRPEIIHHCFNLITKSPYYELR